MNFAPQGLRSGVRPQMNVTPLVDVVLVLLIIFMVIAPMLNKQFLLRLPAKSHAALPNSGPKGPASIVLSIYANGQIKLNQQPVAEKNLSDEIRKIFSRRKNQVLFFHADEEVPYQRVADLLDVARSGSQLTIAPLTESLSH